MCATDTHTLLRDLTHTLAVYNGHRSRPYSLGTAWGSAGWRYPRELHRRGHRGHGGDGVSLIVLRDLRDLRGSIRPLRLCGGDWKGGVP